MLVQNHPSPGVYSMEIDRSQYQALSDVGICTVVAPFPQGIVGENIEIASKDDIEKKLGKNTGPYGRNIFYLQLLMTKATRLNVTRVASNVRIAHIYLTMFENLCTFRPGANSGLRQIEDAQFTDRDIGVFAAKSGYKGGNDIWLTVEPDFNDSLNIKSIVKVYEGQSLTPKEQFTVTTHYYRDEAGNQFFIEDVINEQSDLIEFRLNLNNYRLVQDPKFRVINAIAGGPADPLNPTAINGQFVGGSDGDVIDIDHSDPIIANRSLAAVLKGWDNYRDWEDTDVGILCSFGLEHPVIANKIDQLAKSRMDCIAVSSFPVSMQSRDNAVAYRRGIKTYQTAEFNITDSFSTLTNSDVLARDTDNAVNVYVPASVCMAYTMLTTDQIATWLAPGGLNRGQLPFAIDVRHRFKQPDRDILVSNQINPIAVMKGLGIFVFGADTTMTTKSALNDIGVRRLLALLHATVRANSLVAVFEPNDDVQKQNLKDKMEAILEPIKLGRGLEWYEVVCNYQNNSKMDEARGDLIVDVYLDPTRYTKRIHVTAIVPPVGDIQYAIELIRKGALI